MGEMTTQAEKENLEIQNALKQFQTYAAFGPGIISDVISHTDKYSKSEKVKAAPDTSGAKDAPAADTSTKDTSSDKDAIVKFEVPKPRMRKKTGLNKEEIVDLLNALDRHTPATRDIAKLAQKIVQDGAKRMDFLAASKKVKELNLPIDPFEQYNLSEARFQETLMKFQEDEEVMMLAEKVLPKMHNPPAGDGSMSRKDLSLDDVIAVHDTMVTTLSHVLQEFQSLTKSVRHTFSPKQCETTAELLVSIAVERKYGFVSDDVERALAMYEQQLSQRPEFAQASNILTGIMAQLAGSAKPRFDKEEFLNYLEELSDQAQCVKETVAKLHDAMNKGKLTMLESYKIFEDLTTQTQDNAIRVESLNPQELREHHDLFGDDEKVQTAWETSGAEVQMLMQLAASGVPPTMGSMRGSSSGKSQQAFNKKVEKLKVNDIIEMQELMVAELKRQSEIFADAVKNSDGSVQFRDQLAIGLIQALASLGVEKKYHISAEEMAMVGFVHAQSLSSNERFLQSTMAQQQILMGVHQMLQNGGNECSIM